MKWLACDKDLEVEWLKALVPVRAGFHLDLAAPECHAGEDERGRALSAS